MKTYTPSELERVKQSLSSPKSSLSNKTLNKTIEIKNKSQAERVLKAAFEGKNVRVLTKKDDARKRGNEVAVCYETNGVLEFVVGAPNLQLAVNFMLAKLNS